MAPPSAYAADTKAVLVGKAAGKSDFTTKSHLNGPLRYSGSLDEYDHFDVTAVIGRGFPGLQLSSFLHDDKKIRDLAILGQYPGAFSLIL